MSIINNHNNNMKTLIPVIPATRLFLITFACLALVRLANAVSPPPDGGYPGGNTAEGQNALFDLTTGGFNTAVGFLSLRSDTTGAFNTAVGAGTLLANTGDQNTATGAGALLSNTTGAGNTANGAFTLFSNTEGRSNTATGEGALSNNTTGNTNTATGEGALNNNTIGGGNTAVGESALRSNTTGNGNTANGAAALNSNTTGNANTATGDSALSGNTEGNSNTATGVGALSSNSTGNDNTANGQLALSSNTTGLNNTACGQGALSANTTGSGNIALGIGAGFNVTTASNVICIGADGQNVSNSCYIGNIFGTTSSGGAAVLVNSDGRLGTMTSSRRFKEEIKPMEGASEALFALKPVAFRYKKDIDPAGTPQLGLVAEDVDKVNPNLIVRDKEGKPYSVRYDQVNAMLLNEFLKEHRKVQELEARLAQQERNFSARLNEEDAKIQKVSDSIQLSKATPQTADNR